MEAAFLRYMPAILDDREYIERRPIGMANETPNGYQIIFQDGLSRYARAVLAVMKE